jgi:hypothetical protein
MFITIISTSTKPNNGILEGQGLKVEYLLSKDITKCIFELLWQQ